MRLVRLTRLFSVLLLLLTPTFGYNILVIVPFPGDSHWLWIKNIIDALLDNNNHVTALTSFKTTNPHPNYKEILIEPKMPFSNFKTEDIYNLKFKLSPTEMISLYHDFGWLCSEHAFNTTSVQSLLAKKDHTFDVMILEEMYTDNMLIFGHIMKIPVIKLFSLAPTDHLDHNMGLWPSWAHSPNKVLPYDDEMTFTEKLYNIYVNLNELFSRKFIFIPQLQKIMEKYTSKYVTDEMPRIEDLNNNVSMIMINSHRATDPPRPKISGIIDIGATNMKKPTPLPADIQKFIDEAKHGVVYFSMGSFMNSTDMPMRQIEALLGAFSRLKQRVIWKFESDRIKNLPKNVMIKKWFSQNSILAQKNIVLFITHSGRYGTQEALYWGKPMLCIPLYLDQFINSARLQRKGVALEVDFKSLTSDLIVEKINTILAGNYKQKVQEISIIYQDNPIEPLKEAVYWIEYVARHKGATHLKSAARQLSFWQYFLLDIIIPIILGIVIIVHVFIKLLASFTQSVKKQKQS